MWQYIIQKYAKDAGCKLYDVSVGTVAIPRQGDDGDYVVLANLNGKGGTFKHDGSEVSIAPYGWLAHKL